jgi:hypothetical protein
MQFIYCHSLLVEIDMGAGRIMRLSITQGICIPDQAQFSLSTCTRIDNTQYACAEGWCDQTRTTLIWRSSLWKRIEPGMDNIIDNAIDAMDEKGKLLFVRGRKENGSIEIEDTGPGIHDPVKNI